MLLRLLCALILSAVCSTAAAQDPPPAPQPQLSEIVLTGATIFNSDDISWLLHLRRGEPLPAEPEEIAKRLERLYGREGFTAAKVTAAFDAGKLTLTVDEGTFTAVDIEGANAGLRERLEQSLEMAGVRPGEPFNEPAARKAIRRVLAPSAGGVSLRTIELVERAGRRMLRIAVRRKEGDVSFGVSANGREDLFNPVDGLAFPVSLNAVVFDRSGFNYTFLGGFASMV